MPALNFQKRFAPLVESGEKRQTIRRHRKQHIRAGDTLYLYTGMRTRNCQKLGETKCISAENISIDKYPEGWAITVANRELGCEERDALAQADGFGCDFDLFDWFAENTGLPFEGLLIRW